jgi:hypothetical protein
LIQKKTDLLFICRLTPKGKLDQKHTFPRFKQSEQ